MIEFNEINSYVYPHKVHKNFNNLIWTITLKVDNINYRISIDNGKVTFRISNYKELGLRDGYQQIKNPDGAFRIVYNIAYFCSLYVNELSIDTVKYESSGENGGLLTKLYNRAYNRYFNSPIITNVGNTHIVKFKTK